MLILIAIWPAYVLCRIVLDFIHCNDCDNFRINQHMDFLRWVLSLTFLIIFLMLNV